MLPDTSHTDAISHTVYEYVFKTLEGEEPLPLAQFKGKVILIVNTASKCGFTKQYAGLEALHQRYRDQGLVVIGVPSNDFGKQEPGSHEEIASFCRINYGVTFTMTAKEHVTGEAAHPFYRWAHDQLGFGSRPKWNFHKYIINRKGELVDYFSSMTAPDSKRLAKRVEELLAQ